MHRSAVNRPVCRANLALDLQAVGVSTDDPVVAQRLVFAVGDGHINIKIEMVGWE